MSHRYFLLTSCVVIFALLAQPAKAACSDPINDMMVIEVPLTSGAAHIAAITSRTIIQHLDSHKPKSARCGTVIYDIRVNIKRGFYIVPILPLVGEIKEYEDWKDVLPSVINERLGVDDTLEPEAPEEQEQANNCVDCTTLSVAAFDTAGTSVEIQMTYRYTFSCSGSNCTLSVSMSSIVVFNADGGAYSGPGVAQLFAGIIPPPDGQP